MQEIGYACYKEMKKDHVNTFCEIEEIFENEHASAIKCNSFLSATRVYLLDELETKKNQLGQSMNAKSYQSISEDDFKKFALLNELTYEVEEQVTAIEALCLERDMRKIDMAIFDYYAQEVSKGGVTVEYTTFEIPADNNNTSEAAQN